MMWAPPLSLAAVAIAMGAGAFGAIYSMLDSSLPLEDGERVFALQNSTSNPGRWRAARRPGVLLLPAVAALMMTIGLIAALGPARRGLAVQLTEALREE